MADSSRFTEIEALMWRLGRLSPELAPTMGLVVHLGSSLDQDELAQNAARVVASVPRLADRVRVPPVPAIPPSWEPDPEFDVSRHVSSRQGDALSAAAAVLRTGFVDGRPPWRAVHIRNGAGPGRDAVVLALHHSYTDGLGGVRLLGELFEVGVLPPNEEVEGAGEGLLALLMALARPVGDIAAKLGPWAIGALAGAWRDPAQIVSRSAAAGLQALTAVDTARTPASPVLCGRSGDVVVRWLDASLTAMREVGHRLGATVNDVYLAALLDGLGSYHDKTGERPGALRLGMPLSTRGVGADAGAGMHNQVHGVVLRAPLGNLDFAERIRLVHLVSSAARAQPWLGLSDLLAGMAARLPGVLEVAASAMRTLDVLASNVPGPPGGLRLAGVPVEAMIPIGPRSGAALNATLLGYGESACIGLNIDPAAVTEPDVLVDCLRGAFDGLQ